MQKQLCILANLESNAYARAQCVVRKTWEDPQLSPGAYSVRAWLTVEGGSWHSTDLQRLGETMFALSVSLCVCLSLSPFPPTLSLPLSLGLSPFLCFCLFLNPQYSRESHQNTGWTQVEDQRLQGAHQQGVQCLRDSSRGKSQIKYPNLQQPKTQQAKTLISRATTL